MAVKEDKEEGYEGSATNATDTAAAYEVDEGKVWVGAGVGLVEVEVEVEGSSQLSDDDDTPLFNPL